MRRRATLSAWSTRIRRTTLALVTGGALLIGGSLHPDRAAAMGICEDTGEEMNITHISMSAESFLVTGKREFCDEDEEESERRGWTPAADAVGFDGRIEAKVSSETGDEAAAQAQLAELIAEDGYERLGPSNESPKGCSIRLRQGKELAADASGWPHIAVSVEVLGLADTNADSDSEPDEGYDPGDNTDPYALPDDGQPVIARFEGGPLTDEETPQIASRWDAESQRLVVALRRPTCNGGPPPGYFGSDDPGECYVDWNYTVKVLDAADHEKLKVCF